jgi:hypothetical protein
MTHARSLCTRVGATERRLTKQLVTCRAYHGELEQQTPPGSTVKYNAHYDAAAIDGNAPSTLLKVFLDACKVFDAQDRGAAV